MTNAMEITLAPRAAHFKHRAAQLASAAKRSAATTASDIAHGFFDITHNGFALLGLGFVCIAITMTARPDLQKKAEFRMITWLQERQLEANGPPEFTELEAIDRATAAEPKDLPKQQATLAFWLARKYNVAPEPLSALVANAFEIGAKAKLDPTLILAVMAIESGFNPFAQSPVGAQGLMQVMTKVHTDKYEDFGGKFAAFDPVTNLRVGVKVLQECISRAGSIEGGLKYYVGAANLGSDGGYVEKVLAEHARLISVVGGKPVLQQARSVPVKLAVSPATAVTPQAQQRNKTEKSDDTQTTPAAEKLAALAS
jgi:Transglycosylase SLT domain